MTDGEEVVGDDANLVKEACGEEGVKEDANAAKDYGNVTVAVARKWNEVDLIDWGTDSQETAQPQSHDAGLETASSHPENAGVVTSLQQWSLMDSDCVNAVDAAVPAQSAGGVSAIIAPAGASDTTRTRSVGHMESGRSTKIGCEATAHATDTGKEVGIEQRHLKSAENPAYNGSKSAHVVIDSPPSLKKPLLGAAKEELNEQEAREEARRMAAREAERAHRELVKLANPEPESSMHIKERLKTSKGVSRLIHKIMVSREEKVHNPLDAQEVKPHRTVDARQAKLVMPRSTFLKDLIAPVHASSRVAIKTESPHPASKQELHFETVESHQRDGPAWTVQEYMIRNNRWKEVEEVGGIENFMFNLQFDDFDFADFDDDDDDDDDDF